MENRVLGRNSSLAQFKSTPGVRKVDVRVITATNRDLKKMISTSQFRQDLYYRIATFEIQVAPLRELSGDIPSLVLHFLNKLSRQVRLERPATIADDALSLLLSYDWPGNVRELENRSWAAQHGVRKAWTSPNS